MSNTCPRCGHKKELIVETSISDSSRRISYIEQCRCGRKELDTVLVSKSNGKVEVVRLRRAAGNAAGSRARTAF